MDVVGGAGWAALAGATLVWAQPDEGVLLELVEGVVEIGV